MTLAENVVAIDGPLAYDGSLPYKVADIALADFGITRFLGRKSTEVELVLDIEGVRRNDNPVH